MNSYIQSPTPDIEKSLAFYKALQFELIDPDRNILTDGKIVLSINPDRFARAGIKLHRTSWSSILPQLKHHCKVLNTDTGHLLADPSGCWIYLMEGESEIAYDLKEQSFSILGNFAGISLESSDFQKSVTLWEILGFQKTMGGVEQGWIVLSNADGFSVSIMMPMSCPHLFFNPSMTYFNGGKNLPVIENIKKAGIEITEEITQFNKEGIVDNVIIRDPGGFGFFVFND